MRIPNYYEIETLVYIAGIRIPCTSISISSSFNTSPTATIAITPDYRLFGIGREDRVPVQIFIKNVFTSSINRDFILLFEGEINGFGYSSTSMGSEISLNAHSTINFLNDVRIKMLNDVIDYAQTTLPSEGAANAGVKSAGLTFPASLVMQGIAPVESGAMIKSPYDFIDNISAYFNALRDGSYNRYTGPLAKFFGNYAEMINFKNRYPKIPYYDDTQAWGGYCFPVLQGLQTASAMEMLSGIITDQSVGTMMSFLNTIANNMEYEVNIPSSPRYESDKLYSVVYKPVFFDSLPPKCNIITRSHVESIRLSEQVYGAPTRIRMRDLTGPTGQLSQKENSFLAQFGMIDYYPSKVEEPAGESEYRKNLLASEILNSESLTGPYVYDTNAPRWFSYVNLAREANFKVYKANMLKHMFRLKRYEHRNFVVSGAFNPYVAVGYPAVVFDSENTGFVFCGHVVSITHQLSKSSVDTMITLSFCRSLEEEINDPMLHGIENIAKVNRDQTKMSKIYDRVLGCEAINFENLEFFKKAQTDPLEAYDANYRQICTLDQYLSFIKSTGTRGGGSELMGDYFSKRRDSNLRDILKDIADKVSENATYPWTPS